MPDNQLGALFGWLSLALVIVVLVEVVPSSNRFVIWTLGLVLVYLVLTNADKWAHLTDNLVKGLGG